jgi:hypothetical protein
LYGWLKVKHKHRKSFLFRHSSINMMIVDRDVTNWERSLCTLWWYLGRNWVNLFTLFHFIALHSLNLRHHSHSNFDEFIHDLIWIWHGINLKFMQVGLFRLLLWLHAKKHYQKCIFHSSKLPNRRRQWVNMESESHENAILLQSKFP